MPKKKSSKKGSVESEVLYFPSLAEPVDFSKRRRPKGVSKEAHDAFIRGATFYQMLSIEERKSFK